MANICLPEHPVLILEIAVARPQCGKDAFYVLTSLKSGKHIRLSPLAYKVASKLDGSSTISDILSYADEIDEQMITEIIAMLATHGFIENYKPDNSDQQSVPKPSIESKAMGSRHPLFDASRLLLKMGPVVNWVFTLPGFLVWGFMICCAGLSLLGGSVHFGSILVWLYQLNLIDGIIFTTLIFIAKFFHELGHAAALKTMLLKEGIDPGPIHVGVTRFFFFLLPFTDASASWRVSSSGRRAIIALAGIYFEIFLAAIAILVASQITHEVAKAILFQFAFIAGISTLFFNLNPFIKLDGYHLLSDLVNVQNLQPRSAAELNYITQKFLYNLQDSRSIKWVYVAYGVGSYVFRCTIFIGIAVTGHLIHPLLGLSVVVLACSVLIVRPVVKIIGQQKDNKLNPIAICVICLCTLIPFLPVENKIVVSGFIDNQGLKKFIVPQGTIVSKLSEYPDVVFSNQELDYKIDAAGIAVTIAKVRYQTAVSDRNASFRQLQESLIASEEQLERLVIEKDNLNINSAQRDLILNSEITFMDQQAIARNSSLGVYIEPKKNRLRLYIPDSKIDEFSNNKHQYQVKYWLNNQTSPFYTQLESQNWRHVQSLPSLSLTRQNGGQILVAPDKKPDLVPAEPHFSIDTSLSQTHQINDTVFHGQDLTAVISIGHTVIARAILQILSEKISLQLKELKNNA